MSALPVSPAQSGAGRVHARRCARHPSREAAARCPGCAEFFCRECVVEHDGKLLCSTCLSRAVGQAETRGQRRAAVRRATAILSGAVMLWLLFYSAGALLVRIPPDFHDGTVWKEFAERVGP